MNKGKILILTEKYPPFIEGGYELSCARITNALRERGYEPLVLTSNYGLGNDADLKDTSVLRQLRHKIWSEEQYTKQLIRVWFERACLARKNYSIALKEIRRYEPKLVISFKLADTTFAPLEAVNRLGIPLIIDVGDEWIRLLLDYFNGTNRTKRLFRSLTMGGFDYSNIQVFRYIANSHHMSDVLRLAGVEQEKITINSRFMPGLTFDSITSNDIDKELRIMYGGRICPEKGVDNFVKIIGILRDRLPRFRIKADIYGTIEAGNSFAEMLHAEVRKQGLQDVVSFLPLLPQEQFLQELSHYHVFLFPFRWNEPFGNVVLQAKGLGLAVVSSNRGGVRELIDDGRDGFLLESDDLEGFAERIARLATDPDLFKAITDRARERVRQNFSVEACMDRLEEVIAQCTAAG